MQLHLFLSWYNRILKLHDNTQFIVWLVFIYEHFLAMAEKFNWVSVLILFILKLSNMHDILYK